MCQKETIQGLFIQLLNFTNHEFGEKSASYAVGQGNWKHKALTQLEKCRLKKQQYSYKNLKQIKKISIQVFVPV